MASARARLLLVGAAAALVLAACGSDPEPTESSSGVPATGDPSTTASAPSGLASYYSQSVRWEGCGGDFDCTKVKVPLSYDEPDGQAIEIDVVRLKTKDPRGSLLVNPGGPGASGVEYARAARAILTPDVVKAYDVVGFDPRGVVNSAPVDCISDAQLDELLAADGTPDTQAEVDEVVRVSEVFGQGCKSLTPDISAHIDSESAARDMDIIRAILGDEQLNYLGKSYGTYLGAQYAELFPDRVGRVVLDGVLPSSLDSDEVTLGQAKAFDMVLRRFVADCNTQEDCPLVRGDVDAGVKQIKDFLAGLDAAPISGVGDRMLNESLATYAILSNLYFPPQDWANVRFGLASAFDGDGSVLMDMMDERIQRNSDGTYTNNGNEAFYAISCRDRPGIGGAEHAAELQQEWAKEAPVFGPYLAWGNLPCWNWPLNAPNAQEAELPVFRAKGSEPILVVSTKYDPATPYEWGVEVAGELDNATLLTYDGDGHTAYTSGSSCIDSAVDAYFLSGTMPAEGTVCQPDAVDGGGFGPDPGGRGAVAPRPAVLAG